MITFAIGLFCLILGFALGYVVCAAVMSDKIYALEEDIYEYQMLIKVSNEGWRIDN